MNEQREIAKAARRQIAERGYLNAGTEANLVMEHVALWWLWWRRFLWERFTITPPGWWYAASREGSWRATRMRSAMFEDFPSHLAPIDEGVECPVCGKRLATANGRDQHVAAKHSGPR